MPKQLAKTNGYKLLVKKIQAELSELDFFIKRHTAETYWRVGKFIHQHLLENKQRASYGHFLYENLAKDVDRDQSTLMRSVQFYRIYPILARGRELNWTHYRKLITIKDEGQRKKLEKQIIQKNWDAQKLQEYLNFKRLQITDNKDKEKTIAQLEFTRGQLFTYGLVESEDSNSRFLLDLGFRIRNNLKELETLKLAKGDFIQSSNNNSFIKVSVKKEELFTYQAKVEKIIDGDTLTALIDLGFGLFIQQKLRLRGIDCPEIDTEEGQQAKKFVQKELSQSDFIIIKTYKDQSDKYDRYLADIFYQAQENDPQKVLEQGQYLNQELLDAHLACLWE